jgi:hypothetical protein
MKHIATLFLLFVFAATASAQTLRPVMIDTNGVQQNAFGSGSATNLALKIGATNNGFFVSIGGLNAVRSGTTVWTASTTSFSLSLPLAFTGTNATSNAATSRVNLGAARAPIWAYKATNQTNATTNLVSDTALTFTAAANTRYLVTASIGVAYLTDTAMDGRFIAPSNATVFGYWMNFFGEVGDANFFPSGILITNRHAFVQNNDTDQFIPQQFVVQTGSNSGSVTFQFAATNNNVAVAAGSWLKAEIIE